MICSEWCLVKRESAGLKVVPLRCHCWHCDECRPGRTARLVFEAKAGQPTIFITLTSRTRPDQTAGEAARALAHAWRKVRAEYLRHHGKRSLDFLAVFEATKRGWPHLHIVARCKWIDQAWLSARMDWLIGSPIVDVRKIKNATTLAHYVSKYIGKNPHRFEGVKRYWRSLKFLAPAPLEDTPVIDLGDRWEPINCDWRSMVETFERIGFVATWARTSATLQWGRPP